jgi:hypothetical protein
MNIYSDQSMIVWMKWHWTLFWYACWYGGISVTNNLPPAFLLPCIITQTQTSKTPAFTTANETSSRLWKNGTEERSIERQQFVFQSKNIVRTPPIRRSSAAAYPLHPPTHAIVLSPLLFGVIDYRCVGERRNKVTGFREVSSSNCG